MKSVAAEQTSANVRIMLNLKTISTCILAVSATATFFPSSTCATPEEEKREWAASAQNPLADIIKLKKGYFFSPGYGHKDQVDFTHLYTPHMTSSLNRNWNMINRVDFPIKYQPGTYPGEKDSFGLGDTTYEGLFSPSGHKTAFWGLGAVLQIPSATDNQIGTKKWSAGPAVSMSFSKPSFVAALQANHLWSFAGKDERPDVNRTAIEYSLFYNFGDGWWIGTSPVNTADWEISSDETWTIPVGGGFGKVVGNKQPVNIGLEAYSYVEAPDYQADWTLMITFEFLASANSLFMEESVAE